MPRKRLGKLVVLTITGVVVIVTCLACPGLLFGTPMSFLGITLPSIENPYVAMAKTRIRLGDSREEAVRALADAWYHADCTRTTPDDLFFYGPHGYYGSTIVVITSQGDQGHEQVTYISELDRYELHLYQEPPTDCVPKNIFDSPESAVTNTPD